MVWVRKSRKADQDEACAHERAIGHDDTALKVGRSPPQGHQDEDQPERQKLADLDANVETHQIGQQAIW